MNIKDFSFELLVHITKHLKNKQDLYSFFLSIKNLYFCIRDNPDLLEEIRQPFLKLVREENKSYYTLGKVKHGKYEEYYENGLIYYECFYKNGLEDGPCQRSFNDGSTKQLGFFVEGKMWSNFLELDEGGYIRSIVSYDEKLREGKCIFCKKSNPYIRCTYKLDYKVL